MTKRRHTLGRVSYMPQFMRAPSMATHQPSSSCAMTRSFAAVRVVRCGGTLSSGCSTTVRRQQTASHCAQLATQASCLRSGLKCSTQAISNGPVEVQTPKRTAWSSMQHGQNEKQCHDAPRMALSIVERFTREESIRAERAKREQRLEAMPCKYPTRAPVAVPRSRWAFYAFYPVHLAVLALLRWRVWAQPTDNRMASLHSLQPAFRAGPCGSVHASGPHGNKPVERGAIQSPCGDTRRARPRAV